MSLPSVARHTARFEQVLSAHLVFARYGQGFLYVLTDDARSFVLEVEDSPLVCAAAHLAGSGRAVWTPGPEQHTIEDGVESVSIPVVSYLRV